MTNLIEIENLCKKYDGFSLQNISLAIKKGFITGFIGPNGAGKTTTIKAILNLIHPDSGRIQIFGKTQAGNDAMSEMGIVMDNPYYLEDWTMKDVESAVSLFYKKWETQTYNQLLERFNIAKTKKVKELSRGMKVKLQLAVALSHNARVLLLDEPTSGLDPVARDEICDLLQDFISDEQRAVLFSTHITSDLEKIADFITFIQNGEIVYSGTKDGVLEKYARITGGPGELRQGQKDLIIGYREHGLSFEGMIQSSDCGHFSSNFVIEPISLDEIIICMNKGGNQHV